MSVSVSVFVSVSVSMCVSVCMCVWKENIPILRTHTRTHSHEHARTHMHTLARTLTHTYARTHTHTHTHARACTRTHTQTHSQTHTQTHTQKWLCNLPEIHFVRGFCERAQICVLSFLERLSNNHFHNSKRYRNRQHFYHDKRDSSVSMHRGAICCRVGL